MLWFEHCNMNDGQFKYIKDRHRGQLIFHQKMNADSADLLIRDEQ